jgi:hypothetical protein
MSLTSATTALTGKGTYTLDLNGVALTGQSGFKKTLITAQTADQEITIQDTSEKKTGKLDLSASTNANAILLNLKADAIVNFKSGTFDGSIAVSAGTLNISGGTYSSTSTNAAWNITGGTVKISGGTFSNVDKWNITDAAVEITGGTFSSDLNTEWVAQGYVATANDDGTYTVSQASVATVDGVGYATLTAAMEAAKEGGTVILASDVTATDTITIAKGNEVTIDLADYTLTLEGADGITNNGTLTLKGNETGKLVHTGSDDAIYNKGGTLTIESGTYVGAGSYGVIYADRQSQTTITGGTFQVGETVKKQMSALVYAANAGTSIVIEGDTTIVGSTNANKSLLVSTGATMTIRADKAEKAPVITGSKQSAVAIAGSNDVETQTTLNIEAGEITAETGYAIAGNGDQDHTTINISGGTITAENSVAIFHPQVGDMTITGKTVITGYKGGIQFCGAGTLTIGDGSSTMPKITATMDNTEVPTKSSEESDGCVADGAALSIVSRGGDYQANDQTMIVIINNAELVSSHNAAISVYRFAKVNGEWKSNNDSGIATSYLERLTILSGSFTSSDSAKDALEVDALAEAAVHIAGSSSFSSDPSKYLDEGFESTNLTDSFMVFGDTLTGTGTGGGTTGNDTEEKDVTVYGKTLTLEGDIGVNYYVRLSDEIALGGHASDYYMQFTINGRTIQVPLDVNNTTKTKYNNTTFTNYVFTCPVTSVEMNDTITAAFYEKGETEDTLIAELAEYSVATYAKNVKAKYELDDSAYSAELIALVDAILNYGGSAQAYFGYQGENGYANAELNYTVNAAAESERATEFAKHTRIKTGSVDGLTYYGSTLILDSETAVRFYFKLAEGKNIADYSFTYRISDGTVDKSLNPVYNEAQDMYYVEISNIKANSLIRDYTVSVTKADSSSEGTLSITYGPMTYANNMYSKTTAKEGTQTLMKALYYYYYAAVAYASKA